MSTPNKIKVGSEVSFHDLYIRKILTAKVIAIANITDHVDENFLGKTLYYVQYEEGCRSKEVFIEDLREVK